MNGFTVIDTRTGLYPNLEKIAHEDWAKGLIYCDIDQFYVGEDGALVLADDCCNMAYPPAGRFEIQNADNAPSGAESGTPSGEPQKGAQP